MTVTHRFRAAVCRVIFVSLAVLAVAAPAAAQQLLTNGNFEAGAFTGWTVTDLGDGTFSIDAPGSTTPLSTQTTAANGAGGTSYAVSDQTGPGTHALTQTFTVPGPGTVILTFQMFVNDQSGSGGIVDPVGLDHTGPPNQHARVDILTGAATPFDTGAGVLQNLYLGVDAGTPPNSYVSYSFDITTTVGLGGTFQIRFAETDNQLFLNQGVDNVSIVFTPAGGVPTMPPWVLGVLATLLVAGAWWALRRNNGYQAA
jgi:hypothetical protein